MNHSFIIRKIAKELKLAGEHEICNKLMIVLADIDESFSPMADLTFSFIMRQLNKNNKEKAKEFQIAFKKAFDQAFLEELDEPGEAALMQALQEVKLEDSDLNE